MWAKIKGLLISKKTWVAIIGGVAVGVMNALEVSAETQTKVIALIGTLLATIGLADFGKAKQEK